MIEVCVVGEINLDLVLYGLPKDLVLDREHLASDMALTLGSSSAIFAHNLCTLGTQVGFISKIGSDPLGKMAVGTPLRRGRRHQPDEASHGKDFDRTHCRVALPAASIHAHLSGNHV